MIAVHPRGQTPAYGNGTLRKVRQMDPFPASHFQPVMKQARMTEDAPNGITTLEKLKIMTATHRI